MLAHQGAVVKGFNVKQNYSANYNFLLSQHVNDRGVISESRCKGRKTFSGRKDSKMTSPKNRPRNHSLSEKPSEILILALL